ncbi:hypothetical protein [Marinobacterium rhizophilum]|uniref:Uncharacterized protein n=1 Tax=Marinobacterium rhizophilum TaxID=420402 RepID=A0ABY5HKD3_9GAMM|nr:hypothetical protein [Marinobacterium rhizophilum]UTW11421.1 hypothetical protein KDW95_19510 [Marinobacterium rhizophilum]
MSQGTREPHNAIHFNTTFTEAGLPLADVRLIRHKDSRAKRGRSPYELWRDNRELFEWYQSTQTFANRPRLNAPYWAAFVANHADETMFAGLYAVRYRGLLEKDTPMPHMDGIDVAGSCDVYDLTLQETLSDLVGRLFIDWGKGALAWVQYASRQNKPIVQLTREFQEPEFPGFLNFMEPLSKLDRLPASWITSLKSARGVYLLTCPKTKEQYVGSATGETLQLLIEDVASKCGLTPLKHTQKCLRFSLNDRFREEVVHIARDTFVGAPFLVIVLRPDFSLQKENVLNTLSDVTVHLSDGKRELYNSNFGQAYKNKLMAKGDHSAAFGHGWEVSIEEGFDTLAEFLVTISWSKAA